MRPLFQHAQNFTDSGSGYATEVVYLLNTGASTTAPDTVSEYAAVHDLRVLYYDVGTDTLLKVEVLLPGTSTWKEWLSLSTTGLTEKDLLGFAGVRLRALSQGNADTASALILWS